MQLFYFMDPMTLPEIQSFIDYLKFERRYSSLTIRAYKVDLEQFFYFLQLQYGQIKPEEINHSFIRSWLTFLKEQEISTRTINRKISTLKSFFKFHLKQGTIQHTPMSKVISPKISKRLPVFIKEEDIANLISNLKNNSEDWESQNSKMLILLFYATGIRLNELINLRESQIDYYKKQIKVLGKGNKERIIPVGKEIIGHIKDYIQSKRKEFKKTDDVFLVTSKGMKLYPRYAYKLVNDILNETVKTLDKKSPHVLRHTFATHLMNNGANLEAVKELLGHASLATTQVYTHNTIGKLKDVYKRSHPKA